MEPAGDQRQEGPEELTTWRPRCGLASQVMVWMILAGVGVSIVGLVVAVLVMWLS